MADKEKKDESAEATAAGAEAPAKKKSPIMTIAIVAVVMILEAVGIFAVVGMTGRGAGDAAAAGLEHEGHDDADDLVELPLVSDRFQNLQTGKTWIWNVEIVLSVKKKNEAAVTQAVQAKSAEILEGVSMIFSRAQLSQLKEPGRQTINRQIIAYINRIVGPDAEDHPRIDRILFPKFVGFEAD
ncbi:MAG: flagellar basal body-associated FliL family protein [Phycisphaerales bacterium]|nr:flagellar basal body-associated FliL family protein [Phycisphaerales bacterium]